MRIAAAKRVRDLGFLPIPHISARRLQSHEELERFLADLQREVGTDHAFVVAGDPPQPMGPFEDAFSTKPASMHWFESGCRGLRA